MKEEFVKFVDWMKEYKTRKQLKKDVNFLERIVAEMNKRIEQLEDFNAEKEKKINELEKVKTENEKELTAESRNCEVLSADVKHFRNRYEIVSIEREDLQNDVNGLVKEKEAKEKELNSLRDGLRRLQIELNDAKKVAEKLGNRISELMNENNRMKRTLSEGYKKWRCLGSSLEGGKTIFHFESPFVDSRDFCNVVKIPADLNLSAVDRAEESGAVVHLSDKSNKYELKLPRGLYEYARSLVEKRIEEERGLKKDQISGLSLSLSILSELMPEVCKKEEKKKESRSDKVLGFLQSKPREKLSIKQIAAGCGMTVEEAEKPLSRLRKKGLCKRAGKGTYVFEERGA